MTGIEEILSAEQPFLVIGGHAVILHGHPRMTIDVDLLISEGSESWWRRMLEDRGWRVVHGTESFVQFEGTGGRPPVDLMIVDLPTFEKLAAASRESEMLGRAVRIPSPEHLVALKLHAIQQPARLGSERDWADVIGLIESCNLDLEDGGFRALIERYGGEDAYGRIRQRLGE